MRALHDFVARSADLPATPVLDAAAVHLMSLLDRTDVPALLLKGPALARLLYRPGEHRDYIDVDILVRQRDLSATRETLVELAYKNVSDRAGVDDFLGILHSETWLGPRGVSIDLHWRLAGCGLEPEKAWQRLYADRQTIDVAGRPIDVLGRAGLALHLATHAAQAEPADYDGSRAGSKTLGDLRRGLDRWPLTDWRVAATLAEDMGGAKAFAAGLRRLPEGANMARTLGLPPSAELSWMIRNHHLRPRGTFHVRALAEAPGWRGRAQILRRSLLPRRAWIAVQFPWAGSTIPALLAGYVVHLLRAPLWALRAWRFDRRARRAGTKSETASRAR